MGSELTTLEVRQTELAYYATIEPPAFDLGGRWGDLQKAMYAHLQRFNLRLRDIKVENTGANPGDISIACWMFDYGAVARYRLDRVEVWSNSQRVGEDTKLATDLVEQSMKVLRSIGHDSQVVGHSVDATVHGSLGPGELDARISSYVTKRPQDLPSLIPSGVSFQCELPSGQGRASIILERSAVVRDGALLRMMSEHVGSLSEVEALNQAIEFFQTSTARLGFDLLWGH